MITGARNVPATTTGTVKAQNHSHHLCGDRRISAYRALSTHVPTTRVSASDFAQSPHHAAHPSTESPYSRPTRCPSSEPGNCNPAKITNHTGAATSPCIQARDEK